MTNAIKNACKCGKIYSTRQALSVHRKKCVYISEADVQAQQHNEIIALESKRLAIELERLSIERRRLEIESDKHIRVEQEIEPSDKRFNLKSFLKTANHITIDTFRQRLYDICVDIESYDIKKQLIVRLNQSNPVFYISDKSRGVSWYKTDNINNWIRDERFNIIDELITIMQNKYNCQTPISRNEIVSLLDSKYFISSYKK